MCVVLTVFFFFWTVNRSELAQRVGINEIAESMMAFNTNYKDTGLFGVYAIAKVRLILRFCGRLNQFKVFRNAFILCALLICFIYILSKF